MRVAGPAVPLTAPNARCVRDCGFGGSVTVKPAPRTTASARGGAGATTAAGAVAGAGAGPIALGKSGSPANFTADCGAMRGCAGACTGAAPGEVVAAIGSGGTANRTLLFGAAAPGLVVRSGATGAARGVGLRLRYSDSRARASSSATDPPPYILSGSRVAP